MALQFQPPPDWLVQEYANKKNPALEGMDSAAQFAKLYVESKQTSQKKRKDAIDTLLKAADTVDISDPKVAEALAPFYKDAEIDPSIFQTPTPSTGTAPSQQQAMPPQTAGVPDQQGTPVVSNSQLSPLVEAAFQDPKYRSRLTPEYIAKMSKTGYGRKKLAAERLGQQLLDSQQERIEKTGKKTGVTSQGILDNGFDPLTQIKVDAPSTSIADQRHEDRMARAVTDFGKQIENHPIIKKLYEQQVGINQVEELAQLVNSGNTVASSAMGTKMAKAMGEVGVLTETDVKRYVQSGKLTQGTADTLNKWISGRPTEATMVEIGEIAGILEDSFNSKIQPIYDRHINRFSRAYKMSPEKGAHLLDIPYSAGKPSNSKGGGSETTAQRKARLIQELSGAK